MVADPLVEIEDFSGKEFWPEWEILFWTNHRYIVKAPDEQKAIIAANIERELETIQATYLMPRL